MKIYRDAFARNDIYSAAATSVIIAVVDPRAVVRLPAAGPVARLREEDQ